jgi:SH3-like domain-containing protein
MSLSLAGRRRMGSVVLSLACICIAAAVTWSVVGKREPAAPLAGAGDITGSVVEESPRPTGPSGLPIPRFVSLKAEKVNVRRGPSSDHPVAWVFQRKGLPVEIVAEFETWRRIRDSDGEEGWILQNMLAGKRTAVIAPWKKGMTVPIHGAPAADASLIAQLGAGVVADVDSCDGRWCELNAAGYDGYVEQTQLWGVYPGEKVD